MAALLTRTAIVIPKKATGIPGVAVQACCYSSEDPKTYKNPTTASLGRGTGGRSSFNGVVCTIFGSTGFIGSSLCSKMGRTGTQLILPYRGDFYRVRDNKLVGDLGQVLFQPFHLKDDDSLIKCMKYSNVVVNLIGREWPTKNFSLHDVNVDGARRIAALAKKCGVERFIHMSHLNASPNPKPCMMERGSPFLKSKWEGEQAVREAFPEATIIRPAQIYGKKDRYCLPLASRMRRIYGDLLPLYRRGLETEKQPVWGGDVTGGIVACLRDRSTIGKTYQFVGAKRYKWADFVTWLVELNDPFLNETNFKIVDLEEFIIYQLRIELLDRIFTNNPWYNMHWEAFELESQTDVVRKDLPTLDDLGVEQVDIEAQMPWESQMLRRYKHYNEGVGEFPDPIPPKNLLEVAL